MLNGLAKIIHNENISTINNTKLKCYAKNKFRRNPTGLLRNKL